MQPQSQSCFCSTDFFLGEEESCVKLSVVLFRVESANLGRIDFRRASSPTAQGNRSPRREKKETLKRAHPGGMGRQEENNEDNDEPQPGSKAAREVRVNHRLAAAKRATRDKSCLRADQTQ